MSKTITAAAILITTMVGAGFLGIPYVVARSGFAIGIIELVVISALVMITMLALGEVVLRTKEYHQLTGYAQRYLGKNGKRLMFTATVIGMYSALVAYVIAQGNSWSMLFTNGTGAAIPLGIAVWGIVAVLSYFDLKALKEGELLTITLVSILIIILAILCIPKIDLSNLTTIDVHHAFSPIGVILFAFLGFSAIPEMIRVLGKERVKMKKAISIAYAVVLAIYAIFTLLVVGVYGLHTPEIATLTLGKPFILLGIVTVLGAYLAHSVALIDTFVTDYKLRKIEAWMFTVIVPLAIYILLSLTYQASFIKILGIGGILSGGIGMILILLMAKKAKIHGDRHPEYKIKYSKITLGIIVIILIIGIITELKKLF